MKSEPKAGKSQKKILIVLACILLAAITVLVIIIVNNEGETNEQVSDTQETNTAEIVSDDTQEQPFVPGKNDKIIQAVDDLDYCVLTMRYYFNEEGKLYRVEHTAEYLDNDQAKMDYAIIESMGDFSEYSMEDNTIKSVLTPEGIEKNYPDADFDSIIEYVKSREMKYEIIQ